MIINTQTPLVNYPKFTSLPDSVKEFAIDYNTVLKIRLICSKHRLNEEQTIQTAHINGLIIIKEIPPANFVIDLQDTLKIDNQTAKNLADDLYQQIIKEAETLYILGTGQTPTTQQSSPTMPQQTVQNAPQPQAPQIKPQINQNIASPTPASPPITPQPKTATPSIDRYMEPIEETSQPLRPRIDGNVIDLKNQR